MSTTSLPKILGAGSDVYSNAVTQRALIVGTNCAAACLARDLKEYPLAGFLPTAYLTANPSVPDSPLIAKSSLPVAGDLAQLSRLVRDENITVVFLADESEEVETLVREFTAKWRGQPITVYRVRAFYEEVLQKIPSVCINETWFGQERGFRLLSSRIDTAAKRLFDMLFGFLLTIVALPLMLVAALAVKMDSPGPIFYSQIRTGKDGKPFRVFKFRSMYQNAESGGARWASEHDPRITRVGRFLRSSRIDELPQLWNVLKGEMSLIGPRPERPEFDTTLAEEIPHYQTRYRIKPGLSGWAQVMYPYGASVDDAREKLAYDLYYIKNCSALLDLVITWKTIQVVLFRKGR